jgi:hypothetical protein
MSVRNRSGRPPLHRDAHEADRPVTKRSWRHARYGDAPERAEGNAAQDRTFSEAADAVKSGDLRPEKP